MAYEQLIYESGVIARIILNRPQYRNALSRVLQEELDDAFTAAAADPEVRVIVLSGNGAAFCAGNDTGSAPELADRERRPAPTDPQGQYLHGREFGLDRALRLRNLPKPTLAMVQGWCIVAAWYLASSMDIIFAAEDAKFILPPNYHLTIYDGPLSARKAKELLFENRAIPADEALQLGMINRVYAIADLERETLAYAERLAEKEPWPLQQLKYSINQTLDALGFTTAQAAAFHTLHMARGAPPAPRGEGGTRRTGQVADALRREP